MLRHCDFMPLRPGPMLLVGVPLMPLNPIRLRDVVDWVNRAELRRALIGGVRGGRHGFERIPMPDRILEQKIHPAAVADRVPPSTFVDRVPVALQLGGNFVEKSVADFSDVERRSVVRLRHLVLSLLRSV